MWIASEFCERFTASILIQLLHLYTSNLFNTNGNNWNLSINSKVHYVSLYAHTRFLNVIRLSAIWFNITCIRIFFSNRIPTNHKHENHILNTRSRTAHCHIYILTHFFLFFIKHMVMKLCAHHFFLLVLYLLIGFYLDNKHSQKSVCFIHLKMYAHMQFMFELKKKKKEERTKKQVAFKLLDNFLLHDQWRMAMRWSWWVVKARAYLHVCNVSAQFVWNFISNIHITHTGYKSCEMDFFRMCVCVSHNTKIEPTFWFHNQS